MKEQWFIPFSGESNVGSGGTGSVCRRLKWWENSGWWLVIVALPCYGEFKGTSGTWRLLMSRQSTRRCRLCAWQRADSSLSPSSSESKRGRDVYDGQGAFFFFFKGGITGCRMGGIRIETSVMWRGRQEHTSLMSRCQAEGVLAGRTVPSLSWVKEGFTGEQRSEGTGVQTRTSGLGFPVSWAPF